MPLKSSRKWYNDNLGMLQSSNIPESVLKKSYVSIAYHMCQEKVSSKVPTSSKVKTRENVADIATKILNESVLEHFNKDLSIWNNKFTFVE